jgi:hypothetical protein
MRPSPMIVHLVQPVGRYVERVAGLQHLGLYPIVSSQYSSNTLNQVSYHIQ